MHNVKCKTEEREKLDKIAAGQIKTGQNCDWTKRLDKIVTWKKLDILVGGKTGSVLDKIAI